MQIITNTQILPVTITTKGVHHTTMTNLIQQKKELVKAAVFCDYENICSLITEGYSSDTDMVPLLQALKSENKITCVLSTKNGFNPVVTRSADFHEYIEDILHLTAPEITANEGEQGINPEVKRDSSIENVKGQCLKKGRQFMEVMEDVMKDVMKDEGKIENETIFD